MYSYVIKVPVDVYRAVLPVVLLSILGFTNDSVDEVTALPDPSEFQW